MPKNKKDHARLARRCAANTRTARYTGAVPTPFFTTRNRAIPIRIQRSVQTGPNNQPGGLNAGLFSPACQPVISGSVAREPINPMTRGIAMQRIKNRLSGQRVTAGVLKEKSRLNTLESLDVNGNCEAHRQKHPSIRINSSSFLFTRTAILLYDQ
jgi:hypothetical protein